MSHDLYNLRRVSMNTAAQVMESLLRAGFDEESLSRLVEISKNKRDDTPSSIVRNILFVTEGIADFKLHKDPVMKVSYDAPSYRYSAMEVDQSHHNPTHKECRLSNFQLVSPFLAGEEELDVNEAMRRLSRQKLATAFELRWFFEHQEFIPESWRLATTNTDSCLVFAGFQLRDYQTEKQKAYPALKFTRSNRQEWEIEHVNQDRYQLVPGTMFVTMK